MMMNQLKTQYAWVAEDPCVINLQRDAIEGLTETILKIFHADFIETLNRLTWQIYGHFAHKSPEVMKELRLSVT